MDVKLGQTKNQIVNNQTVNGILFDVYLAAAVAGTALATADAFLADEIQVKVELKRPEGNLTVVSDNLKVLGLYAALNYGNMDWLQGNPLTLNAVGVVETKMFSLFLPFGGPINLKGSDQLIINVTAGRGWLDATADSAISYVEFNQCECVGVEMATPYIRSLVVQAAIENEKYSLGDNVTKIAMLNFDKDGIADADQVLSTCNVNSDKLSFTRNFLTIWNANKNLYTPPHVQLRYFTDIVGVPSDQALPWYPRLPQTFIIYATPANELVGLNNVQVNNSYRRAEVAASENYIVWTGFVQTGKQVEKGIAMTAKHVQENIAKIPDVATPAGS